MAPAVTSPVVPKNSRRTPPITFKWGRCGCAWSLLLRYTPIIGSVSLMAVLFSGDAGLLREASRVVGATATVAEGSAALASAALFASANVTIAATEFAMTAASSSAGIVNEVWRGMDLLEVVAQRNQGALVARSFQQAEQWLLSAAGMRSLDNDAAARDELLDLVEAARNGIPSLEIRKDTIATVGSLKHVHAVQVSGKRSVVLRFVTVSFTFRVQWANPLWELSGFDPTAETDSLLRRLLALLDELPEMAPSSIPSDIQRDFHTRGVRGAAAPNAALFMLPVPKPTHPNGHTWKRVSSTTTTASLSDHSRL